MSPPGPCHIFGAGEPVGVTTAAFANGSCAQALEYDDTHNESIVHMSSPAVAASLALAETARSPGQDLITAIAVGNEISCRVGSVAPGQFHHRGFHPTRTVRAVRRDVPGGQAAGLDASADGVRGGHLRQLRRRASSSAGWTARSRSSCTPAGRRRAGSRRRFWRAAARTGPARCSKGGSGSSRRTSRIAGQAARFRSRDRGLGSSGTAETRRSSRSPPRTSFTRTSTRCCGPAAHGFTPADVERIDCPVAAFIVPIVCEPVAEKFAPAIGFARPRQPAVHAGRGARTRRPGQHAYSADSLRNPEILALARRVQYHVDPGFPGPGRFKGAVRVTLKDGRSFDEVEEYNRGSSQNPMTYRKSAASSTRTRAGSCRRPRATAWPTQIAQVERLPDASALVGLAVRRSESA